MTQRCEYCSLICPVTMKIRWHTGEVTLHQVIHYHPWQGVMELVQKPLEGESRWCKHTYSLVLKGSSSPYEWTTGLLTVSVVAGDQFFEAGDLNGQK